MKKNFLLAVGIMGLVMGQAVGVSWADYPDHPINMIVIYGPGGSTDMTGRALAKYAEKQIGQPIVVINKPGAAGTLGTAAVAASKPDGYTIGSIASSAVTAAPHMFNLSYDPLKDLDYIMFHGIALFGPCVRTDSPLKTLKDLISYAKANPGKIKYSHPGLSSPNNFAMVLLGKAAGVKWEEITFKGAAEAVTACLGGHVDVVSQNPNDVVPFIKAGRLRLLSSLSSKRWEWVPDVPTVRELGYDIAIEGWYGLAARKGIPRPIMEKLVQIFKMATNDSEFLGIMKNLYTPAVYRSPEECRKIVEEQLALHGKIISDLGLHKSQQQSK